MGQNSTLKVKGAGRTRRVVRVGRALVFTPILMVFFIALLLNAGAGPARAGEVAPVTPTPAGDPSLDPKLKTPTPGVRRTPNPDAYFTGWERLALRDLAEVLSWPTAVALDNTGRLKVQNVISSTEWSLASIRAFDYPAGASAAFSAEQEDSRLMGYRVSSDDFYSFPAYLAVLTDRSGAVVERRFHWVAGKWILGVDVGVDVGGSRSSDPYLIAAQYLSLAVFRGLPPPQGNEVPTPNPTWVLPPAPTPTSRACTITFDDVDENYWAHGFIQELACARIVSGYGDGSFRPENPTTRAQLAKMLVLSEGWQLANPQTPTFVDLNPLHPFYKYVETAVARGVVSGYGDGKFRPDAPVTRAQVAKMIVRTRDWTPSLSDTVELRDVAASHWAWSYVQAAIQHGIFSGYDEGYFRPELNATRSQLSKVLVLSLR